MVTMEDKKKRLERKRSEVPGMVAYAYNPSIWELQVGGLGVQGLAQGGKSGLQESLTERWER